MTCSLFFPSFQPQIPILAPGELGVLSKLARNLRRGGERPTCSGSNSVKEETTARDLDLAEPAECSLI